MKYVRDIVTSSSVLVALAGCGSGSSPIDLAPIANPTTVPAAASLRVRVVNGSPGTGTVDVYIYLHGTLRPGTPTFSGVRFGGITPFVHEIAATYDIDVLRTGAVSVEAPIVHASSLAATGLDPVHQRDSMMQSFVISGTSLNGTRAIQAFYEPYEAPGRSALVVHHASPAANASTALGPIGIGVYSATTYPPGTVATAIAVRATKQIFALTFVQNPQAVPNPNAIAFGGSMLFATPFPVSPFPRAVGLAVGLPSASAFAHAPLASVIANAALSETANENSPYSNQNALSNDAAETISMGTHVSEFLIDADQNGNTGLVGSLDP